MEDKNMTHQRGEKRKAKIQYEANKEKRSNEQQER